MIAAEVARVFGELRDDAVLVLDGYSYSAWSGGDNLASAAFRVCVRRWVRQTLITQNNPRVMITAPTARVLEVVTSATAGDLLDGLVTS